MDIDTLAAIAADPATPVDGGYPSVRWFLVQLKGNRLTGKGKGREVAIRLCAALASNPAIPADCLRDVLHLCPTRAVRPRAFDSWAYLPQPVVEGLRSNLAMHLLLLTDPELSAFGEGRNRIVASRVWPSVRPKEKAAE